MRRTALRYTALVAFLCLSGFILLKTSQSVQNKEAELQDIQSKILTEKKHIEVLNAEWAYLNTPYRLEFLASTYLDMHPPRSEETLANLEKEHVFPHQPDGIQSIVYEGRIVPALKPRNYGGAQ